MNTLDTRFNELKSTEFSVEQKRAGFFTIFRLVGPLFYLKMTWDFFTTVFVYAPGVSSYRRDIIDSVRSEWEQLTPEKQDNVIAALVSMNKHGKIEKILNEEL